MAKALIKVDLPTPVSPRRRMLIMSSVDDEDNGDVGEVGELLSVEDALCFE